MPRKNSGLPYLKRDSQGKWTYTRQIPARLRPYVGSKATIRRSLGVEAGDIRSTALLTAYSKVHSEIDALITAAKQAEAGQSTAITPSLPSFPLSRQQIAGIAAYPLLEMLDSIRNQGDSGDPKPELADAVASLLAAVESFPHSGSYTNVLAAIQGLAGVGANKAGVSLDPQQIRDITKQMLAYSSDASEDIAKINEGDFSQGKLKRKAPDLPKKQTTWEELKDLWLRDVGGVLEVDGYGISQDREAAYIVVIRELRERIGIAVPNEVTISNARRYIDWLKGDANFAIGTQQSKVIIAQTLLRVGMKYELVSSNPFENLNIQSPAGLKETIGYRPFTKKECVDILTLMSKEQQEHYRLLPYILLATGARLAEVLQLRTFDIKQTEAGIFFFDWKHQPVATLPMKLKTKTSNERKMPIHPVILQKILNLNRSGEDRLFPNASQDTPAASQFFKTRLIRLGIWKHRTTGFHSFRGTAKDLWRQAGISQEFRAAFTGHTSRDVGEARYGDGLKMMPDVLYKELIKLDLSWLP